MGKRFQSAPLRLQCCPTALYVRSRALCFDLRVSKCKMSRMYSIPRQAPASLWTYCQSKEQRNVPTDMGAFRELNWVCRRGEAIFRCLFCILTVRDEGRIVIICIVVSVNSLCVLHITRLMRSRSNSAKRIDLNKETSSTMCSLLAIPYSRETTP